MNKKKLLQKLRISQYSLRDILAVGIPALLLIIGAFYVTAQFIRPAPPKQLTLSTGSAGGAYESYGLRYRDFLARYGIELILKPSAGAMENLQRLRAGETDAAFIQSGIAEITEDEGIQALGDLYPEPMWIFYRAEAFTNRPELLTDLRGKRIAIGGEGSGTRQLALTLLNVSGVDDKSAHLSPQSGQKALDQLQTGRLDVVMSVGAPRSPAIWQLLYAPGVKLMSLREAEAYTRHFPYLSRQTLPEGSIDLISHMPPTDIQMVAPAAVLVVKENLHPALANVLLWAASDLHRDADIFQRPNEYPKLTHGEIPVSPEAERFDKNGKRFLQRYLPFWAATLIERMIVLLIPLLAIIVPVIKIAPMLYNWRIKSRIDKRYGELKILDAELDADPDSASREEWLKRLDALEARVLNLPTPLPYAQQVYTLRSHIELVRNAMLTGKSRG